MYHFLYYIVVFVVAFCFTYLHDTFQVPKDFFGRDIDPKVKKLLSPDAIQAQKDSDLLKTEIWFKYKEGFSNAVRKKIVISDFL